METRSTAMSQQPAHISIYLLWEYSRGGALESEQLRHLASCEDCIAILWLSKTSDSLEQLKTRLKDQGFINE